MATKAALLAQIDARATTVQRLSIAKTKIPTDTDSAGTQVINSYVVTLLERKNEKVRKRCVGFYVVDEGGAGETAYFRDQSSLWD